MISATWHRYIFLFGIIGLASGMMFGTVPTSIPQIIIAVNLLLEKDFRLKWLRLKPNPFFWILISFFALHIIGMLYTSNITRGLDDLRNKAPLLVLPILFFSTVPLTQKELKLLLDEWIKHKNEILEDYENDLKGEVKKTKKQTSKKK